MDWRIQILPKSSKAMLFRMRLMLSTSTWVLSLNRITSSPLSFKSSSRQMKLLRRSLTERVRWMISSTRLIMPLEGLNRKLRCADHQQEVLLQSNKIVQLVSTINQWHRPITWQEVLRVAMLTKDKDPTITIEAILLFVLSLLQEDELYEITLLSK